VSTIFYWATYENFFRSAGVVEGTIFCGWKVSYFFVGCQSSLGLQMDERLIGNGFRPFQIHG
jgi:hypothetical protein